MELTEAKSKAIELMDKHGLLDKGWRFCFDESISHLGLCSYREQTIYLSKLYTEKGSISEVIDTILHEIAHVLTPSHMHDNVWREKAISIGCTGNRTGGAGVILEERQKYHYKCPVCGYVAKVSYKFSKPRACGTCCKNYNGGAFSKKYILERVK